MDGLTENPLGFRDRAEDVIERRSGYEIDQRSVVAIELIVPAAQHGMAQIVPIEPVQRLERFVGSARLSRLGLRDQGLGNLGLRPSAPREFSDIAVRVALVEQAARRIVTIAQRRGEQLRAIPAGRTARDPLKAFEEPNPFRLMSRFNTGGFYPRPVFFKIFAENLTPGIVQICNEKPEQIAGAVLINRIAGRIERCDHRLEQMHVRILPARQRRRDCPRGNRHGAIADRCREMRPAI